MSRLREGGLFGWLAAAFVGVGAIASVVVLLVVLPTLESSVRGDRENRAGNSVGRALTDASTAGIDILTAEGRSTVVSDLAVRVNGEARLWSTNGDLLASQGAGYLPAGPGRLVDAVARLGQPARNVETLEGRRVVHAASPLVVAGSGIVGILEVASPVDGAAAEIGVVRRRVFVSIVAVLLLAALAGFLLSRFLVGRIGALARTASTLAGGDLSARARGSSPRELATLGDSLNRMAARLDALVAETRAERDRAQGLVASLAEGVLAVGADGEVTLANDAARRYLSLDRMPGEVRLESLPGPVCDAVRRVLSGRAASLGAEVALPTGIEVAMTVSALRDQGAGAVVTMRDVTEDRRLARARRDLVANVSHELKTPLAAIRGFLEILEDPSMPAERRVEFVGIMSEEAARLERLVEEQLELARVDSGAIRLEVSPTDLGALAETVGEGRAPLAERDGVRLIVDVPAEPVTVLADGARVEQILLILVDNALRHTPEGGRVTVTVRGYGEAATLTVTDTGEGIPAAAQPFVFDRFYQADPSREGSGLGLGLAIARGLARAHGGDLTLTSAPGIGSSFTLRLPLTPPGAATGDPAGGIVAAPTAGAP